MIKTITFLSDFGLQDSYVAEVKAQWADLRDVCVIDITHQIPPQNVRVGAFHLLRSFRYFPKGTIHLAIVDPGVGTSRRAIYVKTKQYEFVGPDNGILKWAVEEAIRDNKDFAQIYEIPVSSKASSTFHGRDVFAPFIRERLREKSFRGESVPAMEGEPFPEPTLRKGKWQTGILHVDHYGNIITALSIRELPDCKFAIAGKLKIKPYVNYDAIPKGKLGIIKGSSGYLEVALKCGSAQSLLRLKPNSKLVFERA